MAELDVVTGAFSYTGCNTYWANPDRCSLFPYFRGKARADVLVRECGLSYASELRRNSRGYG